MRPSLPSSALALALVSLAACDGGAAAPAVPVPTAPAASGSAPVTVVNGTDAPVPATIVGTASVSGAVAASQSGAWAVSVTNPLSVSGAVTVGGGTIAASQAGPWSVAVDGPVALAPGATVAVASLPPVSGAVEVTNTPSVTVANTPSVTVAGPVAVGGAVSVTNGAANPVAVRAVAPTPWLKTVVLLAPGATGSGGLDEDVLIYTVPAGKQLVIEYVSVWARFPGGEQASLELDTAVGAGFGQFRIPVSPLAPSSLVDDDGNDEVAGSQLVHIYAGPGTQVLGFLGRTPAWGAARASFSLSGYLSDAP